MPIALSGGLEWGENSVRAPSVVIAPDCEFPERNQRLSPLETTFPDAPGVANSVVSPLGVIARLDTSSTRPHVAIRPGDQRPGVEGEANSVMTPDGVIRPIFRASDSVNQTLPSGPAAMSIRPAEAVGTGNSVITPDVEMRPIRFASCSVNQRLPSGPAAVIGPGEETAPRSRNSLRSRPA